MSSEFEIVLPEIGAGRHPIRVVQWLVDRDSEVAAGDRLLEVVASGVLFVVPAPCSGVLKLPAVGIDAIVATGVRLGVIVPDGDD